MAQEVREVLRVLAGLLGHAGERDAGFLCFDDADRFAIDEEQVIAATFLQADFANGDSPRCRKI